MPGDLAEGVYLAGTGSTGASSAFLTLGGIYGVGMMAGAFGNRVPAEGWRYEKHIHLFFSFLSRRETSSKHDAIPFNTETCLQSL